MICSAGRVKKSQGGLKARKEYIVFILRLCHTCGPNSAHNMSFIRNFGSQGMRWKTSGVNYRKNHQAEGLRNFHQSWRMVQRGQHLGKNRIGKTLEGTIIYLIIISSISTLNHPRGEYQFHGGL